MRRDLQRRDVKLAPCLGERDRRRDRHIERPCARRKGDAEAGPGGVMHLVWDAGGFTPEEDAILGVEAEIPQGVRASGRQEDEAARRRGDKGCPAGMNEGRRGKGVVHGDSRNLLFAARKTARSDDVETGAEAGRDPNRGSDILGNIGLVKRETQSA